MNNVERGYCNDCEVRDASNKPSGGEMCINFNSLYGKRQIFRLTPRPDGSMHARAAGIAPEDVQNCPKRLEQVTSHT